VGVVVGVCCCCMVIYWVVGKRRKNHALYKEGVEGEGSKTRSPAVRETEIMTTYTTHRLSSVFDAESPFHANTAGSGTTSSGGGGIGGGAATPKAIGANPLANTTNPLDRPGYTGHTPAVFGAVKRAHRHHPHQSAEETSIDISKISQVNTRMTGENETEGSTDRSVSDIFIPPLAKRGNEDRQFDKQSVRTSQDHG
jgi:hypothetical protein